VIIDGVSRACTISTALHVKQYFKEQQALRIETTINDPNDFYVNKGSPTSPFA
jgi:hypothetical protein